MPAPSAGPTSTGSTAAITIADGRVLVTPVETDQLYCLNLVDGKELWKEQPRDDNICTWPACIAATSILVGRNSVSALQLSDGEKAWPDVELPAGSMPSGRGFYSGDDYYLPLTTAEVAKINLTNGPDRSPGSLAQRQHSRQPDLLPRQHHLARSRLSRRLFSARRAESSRLPRRWRRIPTIPRRWPAWAKSSWTRAVGRGDRSVSPFVSPEAR